MITEALERGDCDAVSAARPLIANNNLVEIFRSGKDRPDKPCTYCNQCLVNVVENRSAAMKNRASRRATPMIAQIMSVADPLAFVQSDTRRCDGARFRPAEEVIAPDEEAVASAIHRVSQAATVKRYGSVHDDASIRRGRPHASTPNSPY